MTTVAEALEIVRRACPPGAPERVPLAEAAGRFLARGIASADIEARRKAVAAPKPEAAIDFPALIASAMDKPEMQSLVEALRRDGIPAVVREVDTRRFHGSSCTVGRWGLFVPGPHAAAAGLRIQTLFPAANVGATPGCGSCSSCGDDGEDALEPGEWDEDGDWWKTGAPGEDEP